MREPGGLYEFAIDSAIESGDLTITDSITWRSAEGHVKAIAKVEHPSEADFTLELIQSRLPERFTLQLSYRRKPARRYCSANPHTQAADCEEMPGVRIRGHHKHRWSDLTGDDCVFVPADMTAGVLIENSFYEFLAECGITFLGAWHDPSIQQPFEDLR